MITPESIDITKLSSLSLADKRYLPTFAACYLVVEEGRVIYVGQSGNLRSRWRNYHPKLKPLRNRGTEIKIA